MFKIVLVILATLIPLAPVVAYFLNRFGKDSLKNYERLGAGFQRL